MSCRICNRDCPKDLPECHDCWEIYTRLQGKPTELVIKLLLEAGQKDFMCEFFDIPVCDCNKE